MAENSSLPFNFVFEVELWLETNLANFVDNTVCDPVEQSIRKVKQLQAQLIKEQKRRDALLSLYRDSQSQHQRQLQHQQAQLLSLKKLAEFSESELLHQIASLSQLHKALTVSYATAWQEIQGLLKLLQMHSHSASPTLSAPSQLQQFQQLVISKFQYCLDIERQKHLTHMQHDLLASTKNVRDLCATMNQTKSADEQQAIRLNIQQLAMKQQQLQVARQREHEQLLVKHQQILQQLVVQMQQHSHSDGQILPVEMANELLLNQLTKNSSVRNNQSVRNESSLASYNSAVVIQKSPSEEFVPFDDFDDSSDTSRTTSNPSSPAISTRLPTTQQSFPIQSVSLPNYPVNYIPKIDSSHPNNNFALTASPPISTVSSVPSLSVNPPTRVIAVMQENLSPGTGGARVILNSVSTAAPTEEEDNDWKEQQRKKKLDQQIFALKLKRENEKTADEKLEEKLASEGWSTQSRMTAQQLRDAYKNSEMANLDRMRMELTNNNNSNGNYKSLVQFSESRAPVQQGLAQPFSTTSAAPERKRNLWDSAESNGGSTLSNSASKSLARSLAKSGEQPMAFAYGKSEVPRDLHLSTPVVVVKTERATLTGKREPIVWPTMAKPADSIIKGFRYERRGDVIYVTKVSKLNQEEQDALQQQLNSNSSPTQSNNTNYVSSPGLEFGTTMDVKKKKVSEASAKRARREMKKERAAMRKEKKEQEEAAKEQRLREEAENRYRAFDYEYGERDLDEIYADMHGNDDYDESEFMLGKETYKQSKRNQSKMDVLTRRLEPSSQQRTRIILQNFNLDEWSEEDSDEERKNQKPKKSHQGIDAISSEDDEFTLDGFTVLLFAREDKLLRNLLSLIPLADFVRLCNICTAFKCFYEYYSFGELNLTPRSLASFVEITSYTYLERMHIDLGEFASKKAMKAVIDSGLLQYVKVLRLSGTVRAIDSVAHVMVTGPLSSHRLNNPQVIPLEKLLVRLFPSAPEYSSLFIDIEGLLLDFEVAWADLDIPIEPLSAACKMTPHLLKLQTLRLKSPNVLKIGLFEHALIFPLLKWLEDFEITPYPTVNPPPSWITSLKRLPMTLMKNTYLKKLIIPSFSTTSFKLPLLHELTLYCINSIHPTLDLSTSPNLEILTIIAPRIDGWDNFSTDWEENARLEARVARKLDLAPYASFYKSIPSLRSLTLITADPVTNISSLAVMNRLASLVINHPLTKETLNLFHEMQTLDVFEGVDEVHLRNNRGHVETRKIRTLRS